MTIDIRGLDAGKAVKKMENRLDEVEAGDAFQLVGDNEEVLVSLKEYLQGRHTEFKEARIGTEWILAFYK